MSQYFAQAVSLNRSFSQTSASNHNLPAPNITIVVLMDNAASTEKHFTKMLKQAYPNCNITFCRMTCANLGADYFTEYEHLMSDDHRDWHDVIGKTPSDLVITTGIDRGTLSYDTLGQTRKAFWDEFKELSRRIQGSLDNGTVGHAAFVCWSAFALMKECYGVEKGIHPEKFYGLFPHEIVLPPHPLVKGFDTGKILIPQSRYSFMEEDDLNHVIADHSGNVVMNGPDGPAIWTLQDDRITCFINHLEYGARTLHNEYERDKAKKGPDFPAPYNYHYTPDAKGDENVALEATFDTLSNSCAHFYRNLISLAQTQKSRTNAPSADLATAEYAAPVLETSQRYLAL